MEKDFSIEKFCGNAAPLMPLLLLGDECAAMVEKYLPRSELFACFAPDGKICGIAAVTRERNGVFELKNLAVLPAFQRRGIGGALIEHVARVLRKRGATALSVGTGAGTPNVDFYAKRGFEKVRFVRDFFTQNYPAPIYENGILLRDKIVLCRDFLRREKSVPAARSSQRPPVRNRKLHGA